MMLIGFILTLGILIVAHEYGHYKVACLCGVKVDRFSVGFGRVLWRRQPTPGGTEFAISAIPFGGYVKWKDTRYDNVPPSERATAFDQQPLRNRVAIVAAGPVTNLVLAVLLFATMHWLGTEEALPVIATPPAHTLAADAGLVAGDWVQSAAGPEGDWQELASMNDLRWLVTQSVLRGEDLTLQVSGADGQHRRQVTLRLSTLAGQELDKATMLRIGLMDVFRAPQMNQPHPDGPGDRAGLRQGDLVLSIDGEPVADAMAVIGRVRAYTDPARGPMHWMVERGGSRVALDVTPRVMQDGDQQIGRIDAPLGGLARTAMIQLGPWDGIVRGVQHTWELSVVSLKMLWRIVTLKASLSNLSGPLTIGEFGGQAIQAGLPYYIEFLAKVSVSLGVLNLLPLPMLDGGHLMYYLFEGVTGRPVSELWLKWLQLSGALVLMLMMTIAFSNDVARMLGLQ